MEWVLVAVIAILAILQIVREYQIREREIDLIDRALPRTEKEHKDQSFSHKVKGLNEKPKRRKRIKVEEEKAGGELEPHGPTRVW